MAALALKEKELRDLTRLKEFSGALVTNLEDVSRKLEVLLEGSAVVAQVLGNWDRVFALYGVEDKERLLQAEIAAPPSP